LYCFYGRFKHLISQSFESYTLPINRTQVFSLCTLFCISEFWNFVLSCVNITICFLLTNTAPMFLFDAILSILWHGKIKKDIFKHFCWLMLNNLDLIRKYFTNQKKCFCVVHKIWKLNKLEKIIFREIHTMKSKSLGFLNPISFECTLRLLISILMFLWLKFQLENKALIW
jgi:hypothetical protein